MIEMDILEVGEYKQAEQKQHHEHNSLNRIEDIQIEFAKRGGNDKLWTALSFKYIGSWCNLMKTSNWIFFTNCAMIIAIFVTFEGIFEERWLQLKS